MKRQRALSAGLLVLGGWAASSCSPADFQSQTVIDTVRILASRASEPRAKPGDTVNLEVLAYDGRTNPSEKMNIYWLRIPCLNPAADAYYSCFTQFGPGDAGASSPTDAGAAADAGGASALLRPGVDLSHSPLIATGPSFSYQMPEDIIVPRTGVSPSYGLVIVFNFACAGKSLEFVPIDPNNGNPQQIPIGCFDANHDPVGADAFVFGFTRIYAYDQPDEANPVITAVDAPGQSLAFDADSGTTAAFTVPICTGVNCPHHPIGPVVPPSTPAGKQVWADFFSTVGTFTSDARLLYDPMATLSIPSGTDDNFMAPSDLSGAPAQNFIWIVVHDDQGGADWVTVPLQVNAGPADAGERLDGGDAGDRLDGGPG
jgi:hypothetical protein